MVAAFSLKGAVSEVENVGASIIKLQRITGETAPQASALRAELERYGPGADAGAASIARLQKNIETNNKVMEDGSVATKGAADHLADFGVKLTDAGGKAIPVNDQLNKLADLFHSMPDGAEKTALAIQLFGKSGADMIRFLDQGSDGLRRMAEEAQKYGLVLTQDNLNAVKENIKAHKEFDEALQGVQLQMGVALLPAMSAGAKAGAELATELNSDVVPAIKGMGAVIADIAGAGPSGGIGALVEKMGGLTGILQKGIPGLQIGIDVMKHFGQGHQDAAKDIEKLNATEEESVAVNAKKAASHEAALSIIDKANEAEKKGYADVAEALRTEAQAVEEGHTLEATSAHRMADEETKAHQEAEAAAAKHAASEARFAADMHQSSMLIIEGKNAEGAAVQKAAEIGRQGNDILRQAAIDLGQEEQKRIDVAATAAKEAARKADELAKQQVAAEKQLTTTLEGFRHDAEMAAIAGKQHEAEAYRQAAALEAAGDKDAATAAVNAGKERQAAADAEAKKEEETEKAITSYHHDAVMANTQGKKDEAEAYLAAVELEKQGDKEGAAAAVELGKEKQAADDAYVQQVKQGISDRLDAQKQQISDFKSGLDEESSAFQHNLAIQHDMAAEAIVTGTEQEKAAKRAVLDADIQLQKAEMALDEAKRKLDRDERHAELDAKIASDKAVIQSSEAMTTALIAGQKSVMGAITETAKAQVNTIPPVVEANKTAAASVATDWTSAYQAIDEAAIAAAQKQVEAAATAKQSAEDALAAISSSAQSSGGGGGGGGRVVPQYATAFDAQHGGASNQAALDQQAKNDIAQGLENAGAAYAAAMQQSNDAYMAREAQSAAIQAGGGIASAVGGAAGGSGGIASAVGGAASQAAAIAPALQAAVDPAKAIADAAAKVKAEFQATLAPLNEQLSILHDADTVLSDMLNISNDRLAVEGLTGATDEKLLKLQVERDKLVVSGGDTKDIDAKINKEQALLRLAADQNTLDNVGITQQLANQKLSEDSLKLVVDQKTTIFDINHALSGTTTALQEQLGLWRQIVATAGSVPGSQEGFLATANAIAGTDAQGRTKAFGGYQVIGAPETYYDNGDVLEPDPRWDSLLNTGPNAMIRDSRNPRLFHRHFAMGGLSDGGLAMLHPKELILPLSNQRRTAELLQHYAPMLPQGGDIHIYLDGKDISSSLEGQRRALGAGV